MKGVKNRIIASSSVPDLGVRFGQYTIFLPLLLKPAPTRLRLLLWSLYQGLDEFPETPPPGLVTIPYLPEVPRGHYTLSGYHPAGVRAIRIDMLERLADILRQKDSRAGFEATPDMLSITGMTLEQFSDLMGGLGYKGERGEREKVKAEPVAPVVAEGEAVANPIPEGEVALQTVIETEVFYTFTWAPKPRPRPERGPRRDAARDQVAQAAPNENAPSEGSEKREGGKLRGERRDSAPRGERSDKGGPNRREGGKPDHKGGKPQNRDRREDAARSFEARPPKKNDRIDPDNPFAAALMGLRDKI